MTTQVGIVPIFNQPPAIRNLSSMVSNHLLVFPSQALRDSGTRPPTAPLARHRWRLVALALALRLSYFLVAYVLSYGPLPLSHYQPYWQPVDVTDWNLANRSGALWIFNHGDAEFYQAIAEQGYPPTTREAMIAFESVHAFWPLYPSLVAGGVALSGGSFPLVALVFSLALSLAAFLLFYELACRLLPSAEEAFLAVVLLMVFPFSIYYATFYTESLFLLLMVAGFLLAERRQWWGVILAAVLLTWCRTNGAVVALALGIRCLEMQRVSLRGLMRGRWPRFRQVLPTFGVGLGAALALGSYLVFQHDRTGDYFAFSTAQAPWKRYSAPPWETIWNGLRGGIRGNLQVAYVAFFAAVAFWGLRRYPLSMRVLVWLCLLLPLTSGLMSSVTRYYSVLFPFFLLFAHRLHRSRYRNAVILASLAGHWFQFTLFSYCHYSGW